MGAFSAVAAEEGWGFGEVAAELGFDQAKLSAYERGAVREPPTDRLIALARMYGFPPNRYVDELAWSRGVRIALSEPAPGALVIHQPRAGLSELVEAGNQLSNTVFGELLQTAFDMAQAERAARQSEPD